VQQSNLVGRLSRSLDTSSHSDGAERGVISVAGNTAQQIADLKARLEALPEVEELASEYVSPILTYVVGGAYAANPRSQPWPVRNDHAAKTARSSRSRLTQSCPTSFVLCGRRHGVLVHPK
jgi:hypothetical protein